MAMAGAGKRIIFAILIVYNVAYAQDSNLIGNRCEVRATGNIGTCKISTNCPEVEDQARNGIRPTICGYYQSATPIVCCENSFSVEPNDNTFLNTGSEESNRPSANTDSIVYPDPDQESAIQFPSSSSSQTSFPSRLSKSEEKCNEYSKPLSSVIAAIPLVTDTQPVTLNIPKCKFNSASLIVGGQPAAAGEFPYMAAIGFNTDDGIDWKCGGTLISDHYVLTAAHCTYSRDAGNASVVRLGDLDLKRSDDGSVHADYDIADIIVHPSYTYPRKYNDIALLKTAARVRFTEFIRPACLYTKSRLEDNKLVATGWGKTDFGASEISDKLMKVSLDIFSTDSCEQTYGQNKKSLPQGIINSMLCVGSYEGGKDTCQGDSGGPLLTTEKNNFCKFYVIGVTSFGKGCGAKNIPAVYTKVSEYVSWIEETIW